MLTLAQRKAYDFIEQFIQQNDHAPTAAEIAAGIGIKSRGVVHRYLRALEAAGYIALTPNRHRNIQLLEPSAANDKRLPLLGEIAAGQPIEAVEQDEAIDVASLLIGEGRFVLRVKGDSMIEEGIFDGDLVVCEKSDQARDGQIVVALIDQQEATLKRLQQGKDKTIILHPANCTHEPQIYAEERVQIQGIYVGLLRLP